MASTPEVKVKKQIRKLLDELGVYYAMPIGTGYGNSGVPDFLVCANGVFIGVEAKAGKKGPREGKAQSGLPQPPTWGAGPLPRSAPAAHRRCGC